MLYDTPGINNAGTWLWQVTDQPEQWRAFCPRDSKKLEASYLNNDVGCIGIRGGRFEVELPARVVRPRYWGEKNVTVRRCLWCWKEGENEAWVPIGSEEDERLIEEGYMRFVEGLQTLEEKNKSSYDAVDLPTMSVSFFDDTQPYAKATKKTASGWTPEMLNAFMKFPLTRGWAGDAEIEDPCDELEVEHLVLVVHGIGESLAEEEVGLFNTIQDKVDGLRTISNQQSGPGGRNKRIEYIPVLWHKIVDEKKQQLESSTLPSINRVRNFVNKAFMDGMLFLSPVCKNAILKEVTAVSTDIYNKFALHNPGWKPENTSMIGHSLGGVILFELLTSPEPLPAHRIPFTPMNFVAVGSPITYYFNIMEGPMQSGGDRRWLNNRLKQMRVRGAFRNVFHPNDPVAYRLEPLVVPCNHETEKNPGETSETEKLSWASATSHTTENMTSVPTAECPPSPPPPQWRHPPSPVLLRVHDDDGNLYGKLTRASKSIQEVVNQMSNFGATVISDLEEESNEEPNSPSFALYCERCFQEKVPQWSRDATEIKSRCHVISRRLDYMLQISELELGMSEYISALNAHTAYFSNPDFLRFVIDTILGEEDERKATV